VLHEKQLLLLRYNRATDPTCDALCGLSNQQGYGTRQPSRRPDGQSGFPGHLVPDELSIARSASGYQAESLARLERWLSILQLPRESAYQHQTAELSCAPAVHVFAHLLRARERIARRIHLRAWGCEGMDFLAAHCVITQQSERPELQILPERNPSP